MNYTLRYEGIGKGARTGHRQIDTQIEYCRRRSRQRAGQLWPLYCFYNGWVGPWPSGVELIDGRSIPSGDRLKTYGCAIVPATAVRTILAAPRGKRTGFRHYLLYSRPWSELFPHPDAKIPDDKDTTHLIASGVHSWFLLAADQQNPSPRTHICHS
jgi:hypothetical protein